MKGNVTEAYVTAAKAGDRQAWGFLFNSCYPSLYAYALRICGNTDECQDALQDAFLCAYLNIQQLKEADAFYSWMKKILLRCCYRQLQRHRKFPASFSSQAGSWEDEISRHIDDTASRTQLFETLSHLPELQRSALLLRYFSGWQSYESIAAVMSVPVGTVRSRLNQARQKLAELWQYHEDAGNAVYQEARSWNHFYHEHFSGLYDSLAVRERFYVHLHPHVQLVYTSGKKASGRQLLEAEIEDDLTHGSRFLPEKIISNGNVTLIEGPNMNHPDFPDHCPASMVLVVYREGATAARLNLYHAPKKKPDREMNF